jgi:TPR repeat protein
VIAARGDTLYVMVTSGPIPAVGDTATVMNRTDADGNAMPVGDWRVTEVRDSEITAVLVRRMVGDPSEGMEVLFRKSGRVATPDGADVDVPGTASSGVPGKVTEVRGEAVTIRLEREAVAVVGDRIELSYAAGEDTISVGTWRVTGVRDDGTVDAEPEEALGQPTPRMDALVFATGRTETTVPVTTGGGKTGENSRADQLFAEAVQIQPKDPAEAVRLFVEAAAMGHAEAAERAATAYHHGQGVPRDDARAAPLFRQAAEAGRPSAQNYYGAFLADGKGGLARDDVRAVFWYQRAAAGGDDWAQANLCIRHVNGEGVEQDYQEALRLCRLSAAKNNPAALDHLGWIHQNGFGVDKDLTEAAAFYRRSAELDNANGQNNLAYMYENGWGVDRDSEQALLWYRRAAAQGYGLAHWNLGRIYNDGVGVAVDQARAIEHWQQAARTGHAGSQEKLRELGRTW